jgi:hypothetical protein
MLRKAFVAFAVSVAALVHASAADYNSRTHYYSVEYLKPVVGQDVSIIHIVVNKTITPEEAERLLRVELARAIELFPPRGLTVMAYAWIETGAKGSDQPVKLLDGSGFLIYTWEKKQVQTENQYDVSKQKSPQAGKEIKVNVSLEIEKGGDGRIRLLGTTNLPNGMELMIELHKVGGGYAAQDKVAVANGRFTSDWFSERGKPIPPGTFEISVSSPLPALQPEAVRAVIGQTGENLTGSISTMMGSKMVAVKIRKSIP